MSDMQIKLRKEISIKPAELIKLLYSYKDLCDNSTEINVVYDYSSMVYNLMKIFDSED